MAWRAGPLSPLRELTATPACAGGSGKLQPESPILPYRERRRYFYTVGCPRNRTDIMAEFTPTQGRYLAFIDAYTNLHGYPPVIRRVGKSPPQDPDE